MPRANPPPEPPPAGPHASDRAEKDRAFARRATCRGGRVLVAWSGGADSTYVLERLVAARAAGADVELSAAHVQHGLRAGAAERDLEHCIARAARLGIALDVARLTPPRNAGETWARRERYAALAHCAERCGAQAIVTGHHLDDQVETALWNLLRGVRPSRAGGMQRARRLAAASPLALVRPALATDPRAMRAWLAERASPFCEDETNRDPELGPRNALRLRVIPALDAIAPRGWKRRFVRFFSHEAHAARRGELAFENALLAMLLEGAGLAPDGRRSRALRAALREGAAETILGTRFGFRIDRHGDRIEVIAPAGAPCAFARTVTTGGTSQAPPGTLSLRTLEPFAAEEVPRSAHRALLVLPRTAPKCWRNAAPAERIWPPGAESPRRLKGLLAGRGLDARARAAASVLEVGGRIAWIPGVEVDRRFAWAAGREIARDEELVEARFEPRRG